MYLFPSYRKTMDYFIDYYVKPYCRIGPYVVGVLVGYVLYKTDCRKRLSKVRAKKTSPSTLWYTLW